LSGISGQHTSPIDIDYDEGLCVNIFHISKIYFVLCCFAALVGKCLIGNCCFWSSPYFWWNFL